MLHLTTLPPPPPQPSSSQDTASDSGYSNGLEAVRVWQEKSNDFETKFRESMVSNAQLYNEKTALIYSVEVLKDRMEDLHQELAEARAEKNREQSVSLCFEWCSVLQCSLDISLWNNSPPHSKCCISDITQATWPTKLKL